MYKSGFVKNDIIKIGLFYDFIKICHNRELHPRHMIGNHAIFSLIYYGVAPLWFYTDLRILGILIKLWCQIHTIFSICANYMIPTRIELVSSLCKSDILTIGLWDRSLYQNWTGVSNESSWRPNHWSKRLMDLEWIEHSLALYQNARLTVVV